MLFSERFEIDFKLCSGVFRKVDDVPLLGRLDGDDEDEDVEGVLMFGSPPLMAAMADELKSN